MMKKKTKEFSTGENRGNGVSSKHPLLSPLPPVQFFLLLILGVFLFAPVGGAHEARPAYLEIKETAPGKFSVLWRTPVLAGMRLPIVLKLPDDVRNLEAPTVQELADSLLERHSIDAGPNGLAGKRIEFVGLQLTITDVLVRVEMLDGRKWTTIARPSQPWVEIAASQSWWEVMGTYIVEGIRHILFGADHLLFVLGLLLIVKDRWMLLKTVTAFTVAHSITLAIATLGYAEAPALPLNAAIALSILFSRTERCETGYVMRDRIGESDTHPASRICISHPHLASIPVGGGVRLRAASRLRFRQRADQRRPAPKRPAAGAGKLQCWRRTRAARFHRACSGVGAFLPRAGNPLATLGTGTSRIYGRLARSVLDDPESGDDDCGMIRGCGMRDTGCEIRDTRCATRSRDTRIPHLVSRISNLIL